MRKIIFLFLVSFVFSCAPYNKLYTIKAEQIITVPEFNERRETHFIKDNQGNVFTVFRVSRQKNDSIYKIVKRLSYNREKSLQYYYLENIK